MIGDIAAFLRTTEDILCFKSHGILSPSSVRVSRCGHRPRTSLYVRILTRKSEVAEHMSCISRGYYELLENPLKHRHLLRYYTKHHASVRCKCASDIYISKGFSSRFQDSRQLSESFTFFNSIERFIRRVSSGFTKCKGGERRKCALHER